MSDFEYIPFDFKPKFGFLAILRTLLGENFSSGGFKLGVVVVNNNYRFRG